MSSKNSDPTHWRNYDRTKRTTISPTWSESVPKKGGAFIKKSHTRDFCSVSSVIRIDMCDLISVYLLCHLEMWRRCRKNLWERSGRSFSSTVSWKLYIHNWLQYWFWKHFFVISTGVIRILPAPNRLRQILFPICHRPLGYITRDLPPMTLWYWITRRGGKTGCCKNTVIRVKSVPTVIYWRNYIDNAIIFGNRWPLDRYWIHICIKNRH